jgi:N-ethylmaleimide reductase
MSAAQSQSTPAAAAAVSHDSPLQAGDLQLRNRVVFAPCTRNRGYVPGPVQAEYYAQRAAGGLLIHEATLPELQGFACSSAPGIYEPEQIEGHKLVTGAVHAAGGQIVLQVMNIGRMAHPLLQGGRLAYGPSAIAASGVRISKQLNEEAYPYFDHERKVVVRSHEDNVPRVIQDPWQAVESYRQAFVNAKAANYDGVEIHGASGYLVNQFLDSRANARTDEWGGSPAKRCKFALEVVKVAISVFGAGRVGIKLSPSGSTHDMGMSPEEALATYSHLLRELDELKIAYVHIQRWLPLYATGPDDRGPVIEMDTWRKLYRGVLLANGGYTPEEGTATLARGEADAIAYARYFISNPDLVERIRASLPLSLLDWSTVYDSDQVKGYLDYKRWDEMSESEQAATRSAWQEAVAQHQQERAMVLTKLEQQKQGKEVQKPEQNGAQAADPPAAQA